MRRPAHTLLGLAVLGSTGCGHTMLNTTILPPHRLERPICPEAVLVHDSPTEMPGGGRMLARLRLTGGSMGVTDRKIRRRLQAEAAKLGANRVLATEVTTPGTLEALAMTMVAGAKDGERDKQFKDAAANPQTAARSTIAPPTDQSFYGRGLAYAIYIPEDTLRTNLECPAPAAAAAP